MKWWTLGLIFDSSMEKVLMLCRFRTPYPLVMNGIGGKIEPGEKPLEAMIREMTEETRYTVADTQEIKRLVTLTDLPGCDPYDRLLVFGIVLKEGLESRVTSGTKIDEGHLFWQHVYRDKLLDADNMYMAGDGNIAYFVKLARTLLPTKSGSEQV